MNYNTTNYRRFMTGFGWGVAATVAMTIVMLLGVVTGASPMPKPIPVALVSLVLGSAVPKPLLLLLALTAHLAYGGLWGGALAALARTVTVWKGIVLGVFLWFIMQVGLLPLLGWGLFGRGINPMIAGATLVLHLVYGTVLGWLISRRETAVVPES